MKQVPHDPGRRARRHDHHLHRPAVPVRGDDPERAEAAAAGGRARPRPAPRPDRPGQPQSVRGLLLALPVGDVDQSRPCGRAEDRTGGSRACSIRLPDGGVGPGEADELRLAIRRFRAAGKPVYAHSQGLYGLRRGDLDLLDRERRPDRLWMQPDSSFDATGLASEDLFFKRLFDKYGVKADYEQRYQYKTRSTPTSTRLQRPPTARRRCRG
ncbi:MAG: hypothetical protein WDM92_15055 [Caulobacteraceae bacterium]